MGRKWQADQPDAVRYQELPLSPRVAEALKALGPGVDELVFPGHYRNRAGKERTDENTLLDSLQAVSWGVVRALARHTDTSADVTTRYFHPSDDELRAAQARIEELLFVPSNVIELEAVLLAD